MMDSLSELPPFVRQHAVDLRVAMSKPPFAPGYSVNTVLSQTGYLAAARALCFKDLLIY